MPTLAVGRELRFVERHERQPATVSWHGLRGAEKIPRARRLDPFLASDQRDLLLALDRANAVVDLTREQAQREADRPARMSAQPLDREVSLAGIGRAKHG